MTAIDSYFDADGVLLTWPSNRRRETQLQVLRRLAQNVDLQREYNELEISSLLASRIGFPDHALVRRELIDAGLIKRSRDCRRYWREE